MIEKKGTFYAGVFVFIIPFLGFPTMWKMVLVGIAGFILVLISIRIPVPRKIIKNKSKKEEVYSPVISEIKKEEKEVVSEPPVFEVVHSPKIEVIVPAKRTRRTSSRTASSKKVNIQE